MLASVPTNKLIALLLLLLGLPNWVFAQHNEQRFRVEFEVGAVWQNKNDVRIPGDTGTKFSFQDLTGSGPYPSGRFTFDWDLLERHGLRLTIAPLRFDGNGTFDQPINFDGKSFAPETSTKGTYQFNTYRIGYRYQFFKNNLWQMHVGGTLLVRDAKIELEQAGLTASDSDVGVVPLLNFSAKWSFVKRWSAIFDFEGLASSQGRALDLAIKINYALTDQWQVGGGYRTLEGGADNEDVYNFSWFNSGFFTVTYQF